MAQEYKSLEFARAERGSVAHLWENSHWMAEEKCDGWRIQLHFGNPCSRLYAITRGGEEVGQNISHLMPHGDITRLQYTIIDGELIPANGQEFHSLAGIRAGKVKVICKVFDILFLNGIDVRGLPLEQRKQLVQAILNSVFLNHPFVKPIKEARKNTRQFLETQLAAGEEGVVLKDLRSTYGNGWLKAKKVSTFDVVVVGIEPGYNLPHGKVHMAVFDTDTDNNLIMRNVGKCGIQVPEIRAQLNKDPNSFMAKVIEVKALKIDPTNGLLREPRFVRLRPDLKINDATWKKLNRDAMIIDLE